MQECLRRDVTHISRWTLQSAIVSAATEPHSTLSSDILHPSPKRCHVYRDCSTIAHFLLHTQGYGSKQSSLVPQSICIVLTLALTAKGRFLNLASALTMSLSWGKRLNITASLRSWLPIQNRVILDCSHTTRCILHRKLANSMGQPIIGQVDYRCR